MNIEGAVALGFAKELSKAAEAGGDDAAAALFAKLVGAGYARGSALSVARTLETDEVIDPAETRAWVVGALEGWQPAESHAKRGRKRPCVSPW